jgi:excisionase family DNA binding protein
MSAPTRQNPPHLAAPSRYGPTPAAPDGGADRPAPAAAPSAEVHQWQPSDYPSHHPQAHPLPSPTGPVGTPGSINALARLPDVLTAREAAAILRVGRNQLYQAVANGELRAVRIGRTIRIPKQALLDLLAPSEPPRASSGE